MPPDTPHRFLCYAESLDRDTTRLRLIGEEHHHVARVLRAKGGEGLYATNGRGLIVGCRVEKTGRSSTALVVEGVHVDCPEEPPVALALGCLRREHFERAVEACTELGMTLCLPFVSEKSRVRGYGPHFLDRLRRITLAATKQSFRAVLPAIGPVVAFDELIERMDGFDAVAVGEADAPRPSGGMWNGALMVVVGPEGGFSSAERRRLESAPCEFVSISNQRLRSETAAAGLLAVLLSRRGTTPTGRPIHLT